ncbi:MAG: glycoside hydrolase family 88 protein [Sphingomonas sp.]|nr:glycoside hydrolase family 88 protein [Sphingomonas sp.]
MATIFPDHILLEQAQADAMIDRAIARLDRAMPDFQDAWPAPSSEDGMYPAIGNVEWTNGFWTGMLWLAWQLRGEPRHRRAAARQIESFADRVERRIAVDHHDLGFLYTLSCTAAWRLTSDPLARAAALDAAALLLSRYDPIATVIQAWGDMRDPKQRGRMIIDCNLNLPLLWWATAETGDADYARAASAHVAQAARYLVRPDHSTFHTYYMNTETGAPCFGSTHQGFSDASCWARGQAWGIYGFALAFRHTGDPAYLTLAGRLADYMLDRLPHDGICCWDLIFTGDEDVRDSSAAAIAACGLLELAGFLPVSDAGRGRYANAAVRMLVELDRTYLAPEKGSNGILAHGVYHWPNGVGVDECCIWGDYFYLEALMRVRSDWLPYWA